MATDWVGSFVCYSFKRQLFEGVHDFRSDIFKMSLYTREARLTPEATGYQTTGELLPLNGYTAGGKMVTVYPPQLAGATALVDFENVSWDPASFLVRGAMLYNASKSGWPSVFVLNFDIDREPNAGVFTVRFPGPDVNSAILRIP